MKNNQFYWLNENNTFANDVILSWESAAKNNLELLLSFKNTYGKYFAEKFIKPYLMLFVEKQVALKYNIELKEPDRFYNVDGTLRRAIPNYFLNNINRYLPKDFKNFYFHNSFIANMPIQLTYRQADIDYMYQFKPSEDDLKNKQDFLDRVNEPLKSFVPKTLNDKLNDFYE